MTQHIKKQKFYEEKIMQRRTSKFFLIFKKYFIYLFFREREREGEREGEKHPCVVASQVPLTGDLACNPGMCPEWESNW